jgi:hypothetical protein
MALGRYYSMRRKNAFRWLTKGFDAEAGALDERRPIIHATLEDVSFLEKAAIRDAFIRSCYTLLQLWELLVGMHREYPQPTGLFSPDPYH